MKKFDVYKTIQLVITLILTAIGLYIVFTDKELYAEIASNPHVMILCIILWAVLLVTFFFIFFDFSFFTGFKRQYSELDFAVYSDPVSGIANRNSCDAIIEKYLDRPLPINIGCIMFELNSLFEVNKKYGHIQGNALIREFSSVLLDASVQSCFVGRNGGNKFLAVFEDCTQEKMELFLNNVMKASNAHNEEEDAFPIIYRFGAAFNEYDKMSSITQLIALSNKRISETDA